MSAAPIGTLPAAVQDPAAAPLGDGRVVLLGGLDAAISSTTTIITVSRASSVRHGTLPQPQHDAQAATIGPYVYVFGGGAVSSYDHILRYDPTAGTVTQVGALPTHASDVAVAALGGTAYVVGGYDGVHALDTVVAWRPGTAARVVGHLPFALRYAAAAAVGNRLIIAGGTTGGGALGRSILSFDPSTGTVTRIGRLPVALTHSSAAELGADVLIVGGRRELSGNQTETILAIDPASGVARSVGKLPQPLSDAGAVATGDRVIVAGGRGPGGPVNSVVALTSGK